MGLKGQGGRLLCLRLRWKLALPLGHLVAIRRRGLRGSSVHFLPARLPSGSAAASLRPPSLPQVVKNLLFIAKVLYLLEADPEAGCGEAPEDTEDGPHGGNRTPGRATLLWLLLKLGRMAKLEAAYSPRNPVKVGLPSGEQCGAGTEAWGPSVPGRADPAFRSWAGAERGHCVLSENLHLQVPGRRGHGPGRRQGQALPARDRGPTVPGAAQHLRRAR